MAHIGHTAASLNIFLDIPIFLRAVSQSLYCAVEPEMRISSKLLEQIQQVDPQDLTGIWNEYYGDWWNFEEEWETHPIEVDQVKAFQWHLEKVNEKFTFDLVLTFFLIGSTVKFGEINIPVPATVLKRQAAPWLALANLMHAKLDYPLFWVKSKRQIRLYGPIPAY